jgi:hypothetical protein
MTKSATSPSPSAVSLKRLQDRVSLQTALMAHDARLRNFTPTRDRLIAHGQDANAAYREIETRRDRLLVEWKKLAHALPEARWPPSRGGRDPRSHAFTFPKFPLGDTWPLPGQSGTVQMGRATDGLVTVAPGTYGSIRTSYASDTGTVYFGGYIVGKPIEGEPANPGTLSPNGHEWLHQWYYVIPFFAPEVLSTFTYTVDVSVRANMIQVVEPASLFAVVSVGETANFMGQDLDVDTIVGWPLAAVAVNSMTSIAQGSVRVRRSFAVGASQRPAILLVVAFAAFLPEDNAEILFDPYRTFIAPGLQPGVSPGLIQYSYEPILLAEA